MGSLELIVPAHKNYSESVFVLHQESVSSLADHKKMSFSSQTLFNQKQI